MKILLQYPQMLAASQNEKVAQRLDIPIAIIDKRRPKANVSEITNAQEILKQGCCAYR